MRKPLKIITSASAVAVVLGTFAIVPQVTVAAEPSVVEQGKQLSFNRKKGNCLACHQIDDGDMPGNIGPPLLSMKERFPDKDTLRAQIWDSNKKNPNSMMPPFGRHEILSEQEIDKIVEYIYTL
ncbi:sulfur oxidation c-type cytochrome SoxX [Thiohalomonas denitrificans]|uniref:Monoheme cytochrome SoxX (Sulfur oxidation) n=1 Tax=Thiohalomonas denitrificans TaxID=415747 RepID=A0A1G5PZY8_9GAMM|nr:sulfur oxidation c-type cytochrome SoxX [Thiohalomonas denitrificans]SCZ54962.1 monoheme cytochrome SoxX (sulfur oxidation) [Thiohalomonas denitrificans]